MSSNGHGGFDGEMLRRNIREANPDTFAQAEMGLAKLRGEALALIKPFLKRLVASLDESLNELATEAEQRFESEGFPICNGESFKLHNDGISQALWFRRVKAEKTLAEIEPDSAVGAVQFFLTNEQPNPFQWP
jgi:hypothetical protein